MSIELLELVILVGLLAASAALAVVCGVGLLVWLAGTIRNRT